MEFLSVEELYHEVDSSDSSFTFNTAMDQVIGGGVTCINGALVLKTVFSSTIQPLRMEELSTIMLTRFL